MVYDQTYHGMLHVEIIRELIARLAHLIVAVKRNMSDYAQCSFFLGRPDAIFFRALG